MSLSFLFWNDVIKKSQGGRIQVEIFEVFGFPSGFSLGLKRADGEGEVVHTQVRYRENMMSFACCLNCSFICGCGLFNGGKRFQSGKIYSGFLR